MNGSALMLSFSTHKAWGLNAPLIRGAAGILGRDAIGIFRRADLANGSHDSLRLYSSAVKDVFGDVIKKPLLLNLGSEMSRTGVAYSSWAICRRKSLSNTMLSTLLSKDDLIVARRFSTDSGRSVSGTSDVVGPSSSLRILLKSIVEYSNRIIAKSDQSKIGGLPQFTHIHDDYSIVFERDKLSFACRDIKGVSTIFSSVVLSLSTGKVLECKAYEYSDRGTLVRDVDLKPIDGVLKLVKAINQLGADVELGKISYVVRPEGSLY